MQEIIQGIFNLARDTANHPGLAAKVNRLRFKVLHIVNSPVIEDNNNIQKVAPIKNDLLAPVLTIVGAYSMQTTVNDERLKNYLKEMNTRGNTGLAEYLRVSLYQDSAEWKNNILLNSRFEAEPSYAMNWFISDSTASRINNRIMSNPMIDTVISRFRR